MLSKGIQIIFIIFVSFSRGFGQCDPNGMLLELQSTTEIEGLIRGSGGCVINTTIGAGLSLSSGVLSATADGSETVITAGAGISVSGAGTIASPYVVTNTGDLSAANEGVLGVGSGTSTTATITTNTSGGNAVSIAAGSGITVTEATSANGGTITIAASGTSGWLLGGNTVGSLQAIGTNDNFRLPFETNGTTRAYFDTDGDLNIGNGTTSDAKLEVEGVSSNVGILAGAGGSLPTGTAVIRGTGSTTTASYLYGYDVDVSVIGGNLTGRLRNGSTTSANSNALHQVVVGSSAVGDPVTQYTVEGANTWTIGVDNSDDDKFKVSYASLPGSSDFFTIDRQTGYIGGNDNTPEHNLTVSGTNGIGMPSGTTAQRPASLSYPVIRFNSTFGGFEVANPTNGIYYRLSATSAPSIGSNQTILGVGSSSSISGNDKVGVITFTSGAVPTAGAGAVTITYSAAYNSGATPRVIITPANDAAAAELSKFRIGAQNTLQFQISTPTAVTASTTYSFNYLVTQ